MSNPAAAQGWVKSTDPKSGRVFYANHITRKTQWEAPAGWIDVEAQPSLSARSEDEDNDGSPLPSNWETMRDPTTGKPFYVDHERKITTWTRPKAATSSPSPALSLKPATSSAGSVLSSGGSSTSNSAHATYQRLRQQQQQQQNQSSQLWQSSRSSYSHDYYSSVAHNEVDFSDALPLLEFSVRHVADALRPHCAQCSAPFGMSLRRHHCRLCGDVFCDACSKRRAQLPLEGPEFEKPVRVCDSCHQDVDRGNFFSLRRYLTPLHLRNNPSDEGVASADNVNAALSALTADVQQRLQDPSGSSDFLGSLAPDVLISEVCKHTTDVDTRFRAITALAALLALEAMHAQHKMAHHLLAHPEALDACLDVLERSGNDRRTLYVQEQAAKVWCYITEPPVIRPVEDTSQLDMARTIRCLLDHASQARNPNLQRWSAACTRNLIQHDQRLACEAMNEQAAKIATGQDPGKLAYQTLLDDLINTGGVMILASLVAVDDPDTRAHAVAALGCVLEASRAIQASAQALQELSAGLVGSQVRNNQDACIVRAMLAGGACGASVSQLLVSADTSVAQMGCQFISSLVAPLLQDPTAGAALLAGNYDYRNDETALGACREAAVELVTSGPCLPALLSCINRPAPLQQMAMETLAAVVYSIGEMGRVWAAGSYEEGLEGSPVQGALIAIQQENVLDVTLRLLQSVGGSLGGSNGQGKETPAMRIREAAGMVLGAITSCSAEAILELQAKPQILSQLLSASTDGTMTTPSTLRGDASPRCLGVLETVSAILMFDWQHPSGASSALLDRLMEVLDAGAIPYLSRVMSSKIDWESKSVGAMKGRTAACRLLCCLFGIALSDPTSIGMRRLMEAVESDSRGYRSSKNAPSNLIESALSVLQTSTGYARKVLLGTMDCGMHYQAALLDLVDAALLAASSMCGSSVAPIGNESSFVTGESFLAARHDPYVARRNEICKVACDIVVRGSGHSNPALLPTMMVGGFGPGAVLSSLRLALAIAQNGTKDQHAKLAQSGILVPVSDLLKSALSSGDLYKFSAALALVRLCGPHIAAGQGGGLESVRDAIRIATNVLVLPINPNASVKQIETQESLKSECISALESLSRNSSLWGAISKEALPSIVSYLHATASSTATNARRQQTRCAALRAVLQIVQVPSHAVSAASAGLASPLGVIMSTGESIAQDDEVPMLALEVLHVISKNDEARRTARFLDSGLIRCICAALGKSATDQPNKPSDSRADVTFLGLEILHGVLNDIEKGVTTPQVLQSPQAIAFIDSIATEPKFVRAMCATLLLKTNMKIRRYDAELNDGIAFEVPRSYGPPLILVPEQCAGYENTHEATAAILFRTSVYACGIESQRCEVFWKYALLKDAVARGVDGGEARRTVATLCAHFLALLTADYKPFVPTDPYMSDDYVSLARPLVRYRLLETLKDTIGHLSDSGKEMEQYITSVIVGFNVPHILLSSWKDPALLDLAYELLKQIVDQDADEVMHLFVQDRPAIMSLFDMLNLDANFDTSQNVGDIKRFLATVLGQLAETGLLSSAVERHDVRSSAIAALASACLDEQERPPDEDEDVTSNRLSSVLMRCLVDLIKEGNDGGETKIKLSAAEAEAMAKNLGKKICHMVISRFLERARLHQYDMDEDESILEAPDVALLCAIAHHKEGLSVLRSIGGFHAISLVAAEGESSAIAALTSACNDDPTILLEGETHSAMMKMIATHRSQENIQLEAAAFGLLARLCSSSGSGSRSVVGDPHCTECVNRAVEVVATLVRCENKPVSQDAVDDEPRDEKKLSNEPDLCNENFNKARLPIDDNEVQHGLAACSFLAALAPTKVGGEVIRNKPEVTKALSSIAISECETELKFAALNVLASLTPYANDNGCLTSHMISDVLLSILSSEICANDKVSENQVLATVCQGLAVIFDRISPEKQKMLVMAVVKHFKSAVRACVTARSATQEEQRSFAAEAAYRLTVVLLLSRGKRAVNDVFQTDVLTAMLNLLQWRHDPKTSLGNTNPHYWDAAITNCLILLSTLIWRPEEELQTAKIDIKSLAETTLMLARAGKAPRKAISLKAALTNLAEGTDSCAVPARQILDRLFFY